MLSKALNMSSSTTSEIRFSSILLGAGPRSAVRRFQWNLTFYFHSQVGYLAIFIHMARVTKAAFSYFGDKLGDLVYKEMKGAKIVFENRKSSRLPIKFATLASTSRKYP